MLNHSSRLPIGGFLVPLLFLIVNCSTFKVDMDPNILYKRDLLIKHGDITFDGVMVAPRPAGALKYKFKFKTPGTFSLLYIYSCHISKQIEERDNVYDFEIELKDDIEIKRACPLNIAGYDQKKGKHSFGFIDFEGLTVDTNLRGRVVCNGKASEGTVTICENQIGLIAKISFDTPVLVSPDSGCDIPIPKDNKTFVFPVMKGDAGKCTYEFKEIGKENWHRFTTIGFDEYPVRNF